MSAFGHPTQDYTLTLNHVEGETLFGSSFTFEIPPVLQELIQKAKVENSVFRISFSGYSLWFSNSELSPFIQTSLVIKGRYQCAQNTFAGNYYFFS